MSNHDLVQAFNDYVKREEEGFSETYEGNSSVDFFRRLEEHMDNKVYGWQRNHRVTVSRLISEVSADIEKADRRIWKGAE